MNRPIRSHRFLSLSAPVVVASLALLGCESRGGDDAPPKHAGHAGHGAMHADAKGDKHGARPMQAGAAKDGAVAVAQIKPSQLPTTRPDLGSPTGTVQFTQQGDKVKVVAELQGLPANSTHAIHVHEKGDLSAPDLSSAGAHYNPEGHPHAGPDTPQRHAGDFGNLKSDAQGKAKLDLTVDNISVGGAKNNVVGKPVIIHAKADDLKSQPSGNAGDRIGGGLIEMNK